MSLLIGVRGVLKPKGDVINFGVSTSHNCLKLRHFCGRLNNNLFEIYVFKLYYIY